jgi:hypothetical protein
MLESSRVRGEELDGADGLNRGRGMGAVVLGGGAGPDIGGVVDIIGVDVSLAPTLCPSAASSSILPVPDFSSLLSLCNRSKNDVCSSSSSKGVAGNPSVELPEVLGVMVLKASRPSQRTLWPVLGVFRSRRMDRNMDLKRPDGAGVCGMSILFVC